MGHLDQRHTGGVEATGNVFHLLQGDLVAFGVHAVTQAHVVDGDGFAVKVHGALLRRWQVVGCWHAGSNRL
ncbi:hypothetical protein D3C80_389420 [compost metagenome]